MSFNKDRVSCQQFMIVKVTFRAMESYPHEFKREKKLNDAQQNDLYYVLANIIIA